MQAASENIKIEIESEEEVVFKSEQSVESVKIEIEAERALRANLSKKCFALIL